MTAGTRVYVRRYPTETGVVINGAFTDEEKKVIRKAGEDPDAYVRVRWDRAVTFTSNETWCPVLSLEEMTEEQLEVMKRAETN